MNSEFFGKVIFANKTTYPDKLLECWHIKTVGDRLELTPKQIKTKNVDSKSSWTDSHTWKAVVEPSPVRCEK